MAAPRLSRPGLWPGRSNVLARRGMVCTSQPLASAAALDILRKGGNAIDAAITASATLAAVEPLSTGVGGDMFALYWSAKDKKLKGLNGSGRSPTNLSWRTFARKGATTIPFYGWPSVTVPGCVDGWWQLHQADGKLPWNYLFHAPIDYAREGFPVSEVIAGNFSNIAPMLQNDAARAIFTPDGKPLRYGQVLKQTDLARTFELIASGGRDAFYLGEIADRMVKSAQTSNGFFVKEDFTLHSSFWQTPQKATFRGVDVYELPPNGVGMTVLLALNILSSIDLEKLKEDWPGLTHTAIEAIKLAFAERNAHVADPDQSPAPMEQLLSLTFATHAGMTIDPQRAIPRKSTLIGPATGDTVYLCTADGEGNVVSLISSLFQGSGVVAEGTGVHFQNRGALFTLEDGHPNQLMPRKRPFHTIIPGFAMRHGEPHMAFGVMGGHHQPQGHVQVLLNLLLHGMGLQEALSAPRFDYRTENFVALEQDFPPDVREYLAAKGHRIVENDMGPFGGGQAIRILDDGVYEGASDPRKDGCAIGY
jgi:gamma-glutamyltranspeptidase / glutathione hydrolase